jgi:hypothetical protein
MFTLNSIPEVSMEKAITSLKNKGMLLKIEASHQNRAALTGGKTLTDPFLQPGILLFIISL